MGALLDRQGGQDNYGGGMTPLHVAAYAGSASTLALLLEKGQAQINQRSRRGMTALHYCSQSQISVDYVQIAQVLVKYGADVNAKDEEDVRPLHCAAAVGRTALVEYLVEHGAEVGAITKSGMTPAKLARASGDKGLGSLLKERDRRSLLRKMKDRFI
jgi:ankyrin repeat protein